VPKMVKIEKKSTPPSRKGAADCGAPRLCEVTVAVIAGPQWSLGCSLVLLENGKGTSVCQAGLWVL
jgi:hypothetical protein